MTTPDPAAPPAEPEPTPTTDPPEPSADPAQGADPAAEVERLKGELAKARKWEDRAKQNADAAKRLADLEKQSMTDTEKAVAEAKAAARAEVLAEVGGQLVDAEVRAALAGRNVDAEAVLDGLNRSRFVGDDGQPDRDEITKWVDRIAPKPDPNAPPPPRQPVDMGQGARPTQAAGQIKDRSSLASMTPKQIAEARRSGQLDNLLSGAT